jgi:hypothetical protein
MILPGEIQGANPSVSGFDSDTVITAARAEQFFAAGYKFCLSFGRPTWSKKMRGSISTDWP